MWRLVLGDHCQCQKGFCGWVKLSLAGNCPRIPFSKEMWRLMLSTVLTLVFTSFQICLLADCAAPELNYHSPWCFTGPTVPPGSSEAESTLSLARDPQRPLNLWEIALKKKLCHGDFSKCWEHLPAVARLWQVAAKDLSFSALIKHIYTPVRLGGNLSLSTAACRCDSFYQDCESGPNEQVANVSCSKSRGRCIVSLL